VTGRAPWRLAQRLLAAAPQGDILINSNYDTSAAQIRRSVERLGFLFTDIRILLISHAHWDHDAGSAAIWRQTGARYMVMDDDVPVVESGGQATRGTAWLTAPAIRLPIAALQLTSGARFRP